MGAATAKLGNPEHLFGLNEEIDRQLPRVRSLSLTSEIWKLANIYGFISQEAVFERHTVVNGEPV